MKKIVRDVCVEFILILKIKAYFNCKEESASLYATKK